MRTELFLSNPVCALFGIRVPVISGGMVWASGWRLAAAVSEAGGLGLIGAGSMTPDVLAHHIDRARAATSQPFGVNIPLAYTHSRDHVRVCIEKDVKIVFTAAGSPGLHTARLKEAGVRVAHVVPNAKLAAKVESAGCDAVVAEGTEAGGHNGRELLTSLVLWPSVVKAVQIPVIAAGGIGDGATMAAALILGASGVQLGTRFAVTRESGAHENYKNACVAADGARARIYNLATMPIRSLSNEYVEAFTTMEKEGRPTAELDAFRGRGRSKAGVFEGDTANGELPAGQVVESIDDVPDAATLMERLVDDCHTAVYNLARQEERQ